MVSPRVVVAHDERPAEVHDACVVRLKRLSPQTGLQGADEGEQRDRAGLRAQRFRREIVLEQHAVCSVRSESRRAHGHDEGSPQTTSSATNAAASTMYASRPRSVGGSWLMDEAEGAGGSWPRDVPADRLELREDATDWRRLSSASSTSPRGLFGSFSWDPSSS